MNNKLVVILLSVSVLAACGGGDSDPAPPATPVAPPTTAPGTVGSPVATFIGYVLALIGTSAGSTQPLDVSAIEPALSETAEPTGLP